MDAVAQDVLATLVVRFTAARIREGYSHSPVQADEISWSNIRTACKSSFAPHLTTVRLKRLNQYQGFNFIIFAERLTS